MDANLAAEDRRTLLAIARETISARLEGRRPLLPAPTEALRARSGAFVTLHASGRLRGCIGRMRGDEPLAITVQHMALAAAFEDPRFPPLSRPEFDTIRIEVSVLSPFEPIEPSAVRVGVHGLYVTRGYHSGVFLPQVPGEQGWGLDEYLTNLCRKAGIPEDSIGREGTELFSFTAEVFGEEGTGA